jgi:hypothetical protein
MGKKLQRPISTASKEGCHAPVIPATWEAKIGGPWFEAHEGNRKKKTQIL